ncbi:MAG TPA: hypothetical protein VGK18_11460 [Propionicimonas sp.]|uniref:hypothetical protein n=1 Tax=Propionicimonas sp. TaxID=1955623 RepID=UPI002F4094F3
MEGNNLHSRSGAFLGQLINNKVYDAEGRYCATVVGDRVVYRTIDSAATAGVIEGTVVPASVTPNRSGTSLWGREPNFVD